MNFKTILATIAGVLLATTAQAQTYECTPASVLDVLSASGTPQKHSLAPMYEKGKATHTVVVPNNQRDAIVEIYTRVEGKIAANVTYKITQPGSQMNDLTAVRVYDGVASTPVYVLRLRFFNSDSAGKPVINYALLEDEQLSTGVCKYIPPSPPPSVLKIKP